MKGKIVFFGNTRYSLIGLKIIHDNLGVSLIVTIPDSPAEKFAKEKNIPFLSTKTLDSETIGKIREFEPDFLVVEDYGLILPNELLEMPKKAPLNIHHSLLPKYRGPSPAPFAIISGDKVTGVSIIRMTNEVDAGDILEQKAYEMKDDETTDSLLTKLNEIGAQLLVDVVQNFDNLSGKKQDNSLITFTKMLKRESGFIDFNNPPDTEQLDRMIRAYYPWPGIWFRVNSKLKTENPASPAGRSKLAGKIIKLFPDNKIQVEGKNIVSYKDFLNGYPEGHAILNKLQLDEN